MPLAARAQQPGMAVIGFLHGGSQEGYRHFIPAFGQGLSETGYIEGKNVTIEYRWALGSCAQRPHSSKLAICVVLTVPVRGRITARVS